ncbi:MAG TPA: asparagine synthase-related protein [Saprospiraceae bacterium]|jgi:asparagine synthetase B (glutamine-hydrolysing)|nr:MAG: asparagine synthase [Candidatus Parvibacillus calidus]MCC7147856.1 hypothetical protein [Saprospiraceae bacterium]WKZ62963.1 MAG: asparagine synthase-related protein [Saprospiraceae bacterium]HPE08887.1 asparagine synthase-related protein [Saprospiraceae bacterium]HRN33803.1 asparagine synthase-related protein [Saprospiraceae bacterium]
MKSEFQISHLPKKELTFREMVDGVQSFLYHFFDNPSYRFFLKGVVLNFNELIASYGTAADIEHLVTALYEKLGTGFSREFSGEYSGYLYDKRNGKVFVYTNLTASQTIFYYHRDDFLLVDTGLASLKRSLDRHSLPYSIDMEASYCTLALNSLPDNFTLISEVRKLKGGEQLAFDVETRKMEIQSWEGPGSQDLYRGDKKSALHTLDELFTRAVRQEYTFDLEHQVGHFALLSGGLDSRMGVLYSRRMGFRHEQALCFSHSGYWDEIIARQIAGKEGLTLSVVHLDGGEFLKHIDKLVGITQGLACYTGGVHSEFALSTIDFADKGLIHTGHLGDAVLGSYLSSPARNPASSAFPKLIANQRYADKVRPVLDRIAAKYPSEEAFLFYNRGFNFIAVGNYVAEQFSVAVSPFMHNDFLRFALSLDEAWRYKEKIYIDWIRDFCPSAAGYIWERTLMKPDRTWKTAFGDQFKVRFRNLIYNKLLRQPYKCNMAPYEYYFRTNHDIALYFDRYFSENIDLVHDPALKQDCLTMYLQGTFYEKTMVLSLLGSFKFLFG